MYRYLEVGETIQKGDEITCKRNRIDHSNVDENTFLNDKNRKYGWMSSECRAGSKVKQEDILLFRRKCEEISKEEYGVGIAVPQDEQKQNKEIVMNSDKQSIFNIDTTNPIGKAVQAVKTYGFKAANYFVFEPAVNIGKPLLKSIRYILFVGGITAGIYSFNNPELVSNTLKSCLPKVSIQAPDILQ